MKTDIYDSPIRPIVKTSNVSFGEECDNIMMQAVHEVSVDIDREALVQAILADKRRYEDAYKKGYSDCQEKCKQKLREITEQIRLMDEILSDDELIEKKVMPLGKGANTEETEGVSAEAGVRAEQCQIAGYSDGGGDGDEPDGGLADGSDL